MTMRLDASIVRARGRLRAVLLFAAIRIRGAAMLCMVGRGDGKEAGGVFAAGRNGAERTLRRRGDVAQYPGMKAFFNLK